MSRVGPRADQWDRLETYRQRYSIEERVAPLVDLEKSMNRRRLRSAVLNRRLDELTDQMAEVRAELQAIADEIDGSLAAGELLIDEIIEKVRIEMGEAWSPTPVRGYRVWRIADNRVMGNQVLWASPTMTSQCLRDVPGEDLPHPIERCGPPACGIYAVKDLDMFGAELARAVVDRAVVGVVAMSGKVVEHEEGYRAESATAIAVAATSGPIRMISDDRDTIETFFDDPFGAMGRAGSPFNRGSNEARAFLESIRAKEREWI